MQQLSQDRTSYHPPADRKQEKLETIEEQHEMKNQNSNNSSCASDIGKLGQSSSVGDRLSSALQENPVRNDSGESDRSPPATVAAAPSDNNLPNTIANNTLAAAGLEEDLPSTGSVLPLPPPVPDDVSTSSAHNILAAAPSASPAGNQPQQPTIGSISVSRQASAQAMKLNGDAAPLASSSGGPPPAPAACAPPAQQSGPIPIPTLPTLKVPGALQEQPPSSSLSTSGGTLATPPATHRLASNNAARSKSGPVLSALRNSLEAQQLPGHSTSQPLPTSGFNATPSVGQALQSPFSAPMEIPLNSQTSTPPPQPQMQQQQQPQMQQQQQPQLLHQQQQGMVPISVLRALLTHPAFSSVPGLDADRLLTAAASSAPLPPPAPMQQQQQQLPPQPPQQHQLYSQQYYAQQAWIAQQQAHAMAAQQAAQQQANVSAGLQVRLPLHLRNLAAHHGERAALVMQQPTIASPNSAVASYMDQLSEAGDEASALPVGEPLAPLMTRSSYVTSEQYDAGGTERDNYSMVHSVWDAGRPWRPSGHDYQGPGFQPALQGGYSDKRSKAAGQAAALLVNRVGNMARPTTLNDLQQAAADEYAGLEGGDGEYEVTPSVRSEAPSIWGRDGMGHNVAQEALSPTTYSVAPSQAPGGAKPSVSVAALFGSMAKEQMDLIRKNGSSAVGGVPPDEDETLRRRKARARAHERARRIELERERLGPPPGSSMPSVVTTPTHGSTKVIGRPSTMPQLAQGPRRKSVFYHGTVDTADQSTGMQCSANPSLPMSKMASQDVGAIVNQIKQGTNQQETAFMNKDAVSALNQALRSSAPTPPQGSVGQLPECDPQEPPPAFSKMTSARHSNTRGTKSQNLPGGESLGEQFTLKVNKSEARAGEREPDNDGPDRLKQALESTSFDTSAYEAGGTQPIDPANIDVLLAEGVPLVNEHGELLEEEEIKHLRDEALKKPGAAQHQLEGIGLFANPDDDDDDSKKHDLQRALKHKNIPWHRNKYWRFFMFAMSIALLLMIIGVVLQERVRVQAGVDTGAFRWFYFFCFCPPFWYCVDLTIYYLFYMLEWRFFANSLLNLKNLMRHTVVFVFLTILLLWHAVVFEWLDCHAEGRCEGEEYLRATDILWRVQECLVLFSLANLFKAIITKLLSTHFYKTAHFKKLETALEKEYFLQLLSKPQRKFLAKKRELEEAERTKQEAQMQRDASHQAHLASMARVADKVKEVKNQTTEVRHADHMASMSFNKPRPRVTKWGSFQNDDGVKNRWNTYSMFRKSFPLGSHRRSASADTSATAKAVTSNGALPLTLESIKLLQAINENPHMEAPMGMPFPAGAEEVVGGGAEGKPFVQPLAGSIKDVVLSQQQQQNLLEQQQQQQQQVTVNRVSSAPAHLDAAVAGDPTVSSGTPQQQPHAAPQFLCATVPSAPVQTLEDATPGPFPAPHASFLLPTQQPKAEAYFWRGKTPSQTLSGPATGQRPSPTPQQPPLPPQPPQPPQPMPPPLPPPAGPPPRGSNLHDAPGMQFRQGSLERDSAHRTAATATGHRASSSGDLTPQHSQIARNFETNFPSLSSSQVPLPHPNPSSGPAVTRPGQPQQQQAGQPVTHAVAASAPHSASPSLLNPTGGKSLECIPSKGNSPASTQLSHSPPNTSTQGAQGSGHQDLPLVSFAQKSMDREQPGSSWHPSPPLKDTSLEVQAAEQQEKQPWTDIAEGLPERVYAGHGCTSNPVFAMEDDPRPDDAESPKYQRNPMLMHPEPLPVIDEFHHDGSQDKSAAISSKPTNGPSHIPSGLANGIEDEDPPTNRRSSKAVFCRLASVRRPSVNVQGEEPPLERESQKERHLQASPLDEAILANAAPVPGKLKDEPEKLKKKKDLAQLTEDELERMRTAVVVKTYTSIIRNYNSMSADEQDEEMARVRAFSRALFYNIKGDEDREYVSLEDFELFFSNRKTAAKAFACFDADGDNHVTRREIKDGVVNIYKERANMATSLKDTDSIVQSLELAIGGAIHFIFVAFYLLIWNISLVQGFSTFSATILAFTFIFGTAMQNMFQAMLFLFVEHAYDVGDNILLNGEIHRIKKISLLYTEMFTLSGERIFYPNTGLTNTVIRNWTRSPSYTEYVYINADVGVTPMMLQDTMASMLEHAQAHPTEYDDVPFLQFFTIDNPMKAVLLLTFTFAFNPDDWSRLVPARNAMFGIVQAKFAEHKMRCSVHFVERRIVHTDYQPTPTDGQPIY